MPTLIHRFDIQNIMPDNVMRPTSVDEVLALPSFHQVLMRFQDQFGLPFEAAPENIQHAIVKRRLSQLVAILRVNPLWRRRIDTALPNMAMERFEDFAAIPVTGKEIFRLFFTNERPGMVVPIDHCGFQIVASGGTSSGKQSETVYSRADLQETYRWAGAFIGRHITNTMLRSTGAKWMLTTLADHQMWSIGSMVGGVLQAIPGVNYIGAGPISREVYQLIMSYPGAKGIMGITASIALLPAFAEGLSPEARESLHMVMYGNGIMTPKLRADLEAAYPNVKILSYFAATQAETIGLQLDPESPVLTAVPGLHHIEALRSDGRSVAVGEEGELVVTRLFGNAAPCLRYKLNDRVRRMPDLVRDGLRAMQFEYVGRSGEFFHIGDTQYAAAPALTAIIEEFRTRNILDIYQIALDIQFKIDRRERAFTIVIACDDPNAIKKEIAARLGATGSSPVIMSALTRSLSNFDSFKANQESLILTGFRFSLMVVERGSKEIQRTVVGKVPLVNDRIIPFETGHTVH